VAGLRGGGEEVEEATGSALRELGVLRGHDEPLAGDSLERAASGLRDRTERWNRDEIEPVSERLCQIAIASGLGIGVLPCFRVAELVMTSLQQHAARLLGR
jgi:hypothetical protein